MKKLISFQVSVAIQASSKEIWEYIRDISKIPEFHPRVTNVELISGDRYRTEGATYKCYLEDGKHNCTERDIEVIPQKKIVTSLPEDTMGMSNILHDFIVETRFIQLDENSTTIEFHHSFYMNSFLRIILGSFIKRKIKRESFETLKSIKRAVEKMKIVKT